MSDDIILDIKNVTKQFPGVTALSDVSIQIRAARSIASAARTEPASPPDQDSVWCVPLGFLRGHILYDGKELKLEDVLFAKPSKRVLRLCIRS